jgi:mRNA-degrading endonuclease toxin of MazEF toxin-antitoxin module
MANNKQATKRVNTKTTNRNILKIVADQTESSHRLQTQRGSIVTLKKPVLGSKLAIVVSNNIQNEVSDYILIVPLIKRANKLKAPFAVDLTKSEGVDSLCVARCDWVSAIRQQYVRSIQMACVSNEVLNNLESALRVSLGFR